MNSKIDKKHFESDFASISNYQMIINELLKVHFDITTSAIMINKKELQCIH